MCPFTSVIIGGLVIPACYDLIKKSLSKNIEPTFSKIYYETIDELSDKYEIQQVCFDVFFAE